MGNWALVIGCDRYRHPTSSLKGSVRDALGMRAWLLDPGGGKVPRQNLTFLAATQADGAALPSGVTAGEANRDDISLAITALLRRTDGDEGRLFVFFAGHGLTARVNLADLRGLDPLTEPVATLFTVHILQDQSRLDGRFRARPHKPSLTISSMTSS